MYLVKANRENNKRELIGSSQTYEGATELMDRVIAEFRALYPNAPVRLSAFNGFKAYRSGTMLLYITISAPRNGESNES